MCKVGLLTYNFLVPEALTTWMAVVMLTKRKLMLNIQLTPAPNKTEQTNKNILTSKILIVLVTLNRKGHLISLYILSYHYIFIICPNWFYYRKQNNCAWIDGKEHCWRKKERENERQKGRDREKKYLGSCSFLRPSRYMTLTCYWASLLIDIKKNIQGFCLN